MLLTKYEALQGHANEVYDCIHRQTLVANDLLKCQAFYTFILDSFGPNNHNFTPFHYLPLLVEADLICEYKDWLCNRNMISQSADVCPVDTLTVDATPLTRAGLGGPVCHDPAPAIHLGHIGGPTPSAAEDRMSCPRAGTSQYYQQQSLPTITALDPASNSDSPTISGWFTISPPPSKAAKVSWSMVI
jgi:hypothetical protein